MNKLFPSLNRVAVEQLEINGWIKSEVGHSETIDFSRNYELYIRKRPIAEVLPQTEPFRKSEIRNTDYPANPHETRENAMGAEGGIGIHNTVLPPTAGLPDFSSYPSLRAVQTGSPSLVIGYDSEWYNEDPRNVLSWQFALQMDGLVYEYIFLNRFYKGYSPSSNLSLEFAIGRIIDELDKSNGLVPQPLKISTITENGKRNYDKVKHYPITLVCHSSIVDLTNFNQSSKYNINFMETLTSAGGGLFNMFPLKLHPHSFTMKAGNKYIYPVSICFRDSMCAAPANACSLENLGQSIGVPKYDVDRKIKSHMNDFLVFEPVSFFNYASQDAVIAMLYTQAVYGSNRMQAPTILTAAAKNIKSSIKNHFKCKNDDYNFLYR